MQIAFTAQADWEPEQLAQRINEILNGSADRAEWIAGDRKWMLGSHNDWWLRVGDNRRCAITNRGGQTREQMEALATILRWRVHLLDARVDG